MLDSSSAAAVLPAASTASAASAAPAAHHLSRLLDCVVEQAREIDPKSFHLGRHKHWLKLRADLHGLPGLSLNTGSAEEPVWLRLERINSEPPPALDSKLAGLISTPDHPDGPPPSVDAVQLARRLKASVAGKTPEEAHAFETRVSVWINQSLAEYLTRWSLWADEERRRRLSISLYGELFALKHQLEAAQTTEPLELVWGLGLSAWNLPGSGGVLYPLVTQRLEISQEDEGLALLVRPRAVAPQLEFDAWAVARLPTAPELESRARQMLAALAASEQPPSPFELGGIEPLLRLVAGNLHERGSYQPWPPEPGHAGSHRDGTAPHLPAPGPELLVTDAWALFARPRSDHFLHEDIRRLKHQLDALGDARELPPGPRALVTPPAEVVAPVAPIRLRGRSGESRPGLAGRSGPVEELYFPLPYNGEQVSIIEQLMRSDGVAVQGPPGTGKTHTIANIICHCLALGQRVLVTAKGDKALEVLQAKIPASVRALTVALLAADREGLRQFQSAIEAITHTVTQLDPQAVRERITSLHSDIHRAHSELALLDRRIDALARAQLEDVLLDGEPLRAQAMAERVSAGAARHGWFEDRPRLLPEHAPPLDAMEAAKLREVRRLLGPDLPQVSAGLPAAAQLPPPEELAALHEALQALHRLDADEAQGELPALANAEPATLAAARELLALLEAALPRVQALQTSADAWAQQLRQRCAQPGLASERAALEALFPDMQALVRERAEFLKRPVELPAPDTHWPAVREAVQRAAATGKPFGLFSLMAGEVKERVGAIRVAGLAPASPNDWAHAERHLGLHDRAISFCSRWNAIAEALGLPQLEAGLATLRQIDRLAASLHPAHQLAMQLDARLPALLAQVFALPPRLAEAPDAAALGRLIQQLRRQLARSGWQQAETRRAALRAWALAQRGDPAAYPADAAQATVHPADRPEAPSPRPPIRPLVAQLLALIEHQLGQPELPTDLLLQHYAALLADWRRLEALAPALGTLHALAQRIGQAGAPHWAEQLRRQPAPRAGEDPLVPPDWREAWQWARLRSHLESIDAHTELRDLAQRRETLEQTLARRYEEVVAQSAWLATRQGATPKVLSALARYQTAVRLIGKGTGVNAAHHRRDAQAAMQEAQAAVPCWIMNHAKVSEMLPAELGAFDLVIVDEASQSDLWSLPAVLRGRKLLVVGDDKQVSPEGGNFLAAARAQELRERFLTGQPYAAVLSPTHSLYDIASAVFAGSKVMLREHFRSVAPIIAYSNRTFYQGAIQPLRLPTASERLDPPLVDIYVPSGRRDGRDMNRDEAEAIAQDIAATLADPHCAGRSLGVVSLLGSEQARLIDQLVRSRCDAAELHRRRFECGDARLFQGSERDIIYLSLVVSPGDCKALSGNVFEQRFNVAASRARDRLVLVRSVQTSDLSAADLRLTLLKHFSPDNTTPRDTLAVPGQERGGAHSTPSGNGPDDAGGAGSASRSSGSGGSGGSGGSANGNGNGGTRIADGLGAAPDAAGLSADPAGLLALCDSNFEREVLSELLGRGFRVLPQVKAGSYRIDLVVEGAQDRRLAIECDGDEFHGPDRWAADMHRQRVLERAGWTFWRCFASTWRRRRAEVVADLLATLAQHGIEPLAPQQAPAAPVAQRIWTPGAAA